MGKNSTGLTSRAFGLDFIRAFAIFSVIGGHFFSLHRVQIFTSN